MRKYGHDEQNPVSHSNGEVNLRQCKGAEGVISVSNHQVDSKDGVPGGKDEHGGPDDHIPACESAFDSMVKFFDIAAEASGAASVNAFRCIGRNRVSIHDL